MDALDMESIDNGKEWEDDNIHYCACGAEKSPDFPTCFMCSKRERQEFDDWITSWQRSTIDWDKVDPLA